MAVLPTQDFQCLGVGSQVCAKIHHNIARLHVFQNLHHLLRDVRHGVHAADMDRYPLLKDLCGHNP